MRLKDMDTGDLLSLGCFLVILALVALLGKLVYCIPCVKLLHP